MRRTDHKNYTTMIARITTTFKYLLKMMNQIIHSMPCRNNNKQLCLHPLFQVSAKSKHEILLNAWIFYTTPMVEFVALIPILQSTRRIDWLPQLHWLPVGRACLPWWTYQIGMMISIWRGAAPTHFLAPGLPNQSHMLGTASSYCAVAPHLSITPYLFLLRAHSQVASRTSFSPSPPVYTSSRPLQTRQARVVMDSHGAGHFRNPFLHPTWLSLYYSYIGFQLTYRTISLPPPLSQSNYHRTMVWGIDLRIRRRRWWPRGGARQWCG